MYYPTTLGTEAASTGLIAVIKRNVATGNIGWEFSDIKGVKPMIAASGYISDAEKVVHGDYDGGYVYLQESGNDFDGTAMSCIFRTTDYNMQDVGIRKNMQRVILNYNPSGTIADVDMALLYDYDDVTVAQPAVYNLQNAAGAAIYGSGEYNIAEYGGSVYSPLYRQSVEGSGFAVALKFTDSSTNPTYTIKGFSLEFTPGARM